MGPYPIHYFLTLCFFSLLVDISDFEKSENLEMVRKFLKGPIYLLDKYLY